MARFILALLVVVPAILAAEKRSVYPVSGSQTAGAAAAQYSNVGQNSEVHDKKNFGLNYSSDKGASNSYTGTNFAGGVSGANQQGVGYVPYNTPYYPYPQYPYPHYPYPYPQPSPYPYPVTQGVGAGVGVVGPTVPGYGVQGVQAGAGAVNQGGIRY